LNRCKSSWACSEMYAARPSVNAISRTLNKKNRYGNNNNSK
jgi:hypothetical protein